MAHVGELRGQGNDPAGGIATTAVTDRELPLLLLQQLIPENGYNNLPVAVRVSGRLRWWPLHEAIRTLIVREPSLRTVYLSEAGSFRKRMVAADDATLEVDYVAVTDADLSGQLARFAAAPFPLDGELLIRVGVFQGAEEDVLCLVAHHLVFDGASGYSLLTDLVALYNHLCDHPEPPAELVQPAPAPPERQPSAASREYWRQHVAGADPDAAKMRFGRPEPTDPTLAGTVLDHPLPTAAYDTVRTLRRDLRAPESVVFMAAFYALLTRHGAGEDLVVGVPLDMRTAGHRRSIGYHVNTVPLRVRVDPDRSFADLVRSVRETYLTGVSHADASVDDLTGPDRSDPAEPGRKNWRTHPFRYLFNYLPWRIEEHLLVDGAPAQPVSVFNGHSRFDIECYLMVRPDRATVRLVHSTEIHDSTEMTALAERYAALLCAAGAGPDVPIRELAMATDRDRRLTTPPAAPAGTLLDVIAGQVRETPDAPAVRGPGGPCSYRQLWTWAADIADRIRSRDLGAGAPIALLPCDVGLRAAAILGTWLAGAAHRALDATRGTAVAVDARLVLAPATAGPVEAGVDILVLPAPPSSGPVAARPWSGLVAVAPPVPEHAPAILVGPPEAAGAAISHLDLHATVRDLAERLGLGAGDAVAATPVSRPAGTVAEILVPLTVGGCAVQLAADPTAALLDTMVEQDIRVAYLDPAVAGPIARRDPELLRGRVLVCTGPVVPVPVLDALTGAGAHVYRGYADPRTGRWLTAGLPPAGTTDPGWVGAPLAGCAVTVTDERARPLPPGLYGQLRAGAAGAPAEATGDIARLAWDGAVELVGTGAVTAEPVTAAANPAPDDDLDAELLTAILALWRQLLDQPNLDEDADFFHNGGQSLLAARMLQRARRLVGFRIPLDALMSASTPRTFTERLLSLRAGAEQQSHPTPNGTRA